MDLDPSLIDASFVVDRLGEHWELPGIFFKPYPCNHFTHAGIDAALQLRGDGVRAEDVVDIELGAPTAVLRTIAEPPEVMARAFKLTPSELRVLLAVVQVGGVMGVADALGISENTVKTHLKRLYAKTGTNRQADLVKLTAKFSSPLT